MGAGLYFLEEEPALAGRLDDFVTRLGRDLLLQSWHSGATLVLGGGYGRGEGGVFREHDGGVAALYNDLEFYLFFTGPAPADANAWVARWERDGTAELGIDVEFKTLRASALNAAEPTMFFHDLIAGHRYVAGDTGLLARAPAKLSDPAALPLEEVNRLLFNRGSGLLFAHWRLAAWNSTDSGFVQRNQAKAKLALGDAVLAAAGRHHPSVMERARRIAAGGFPTPPGWDQVRAWHADGVEFKLRPRHRAVGRSVLEETGTALSSAWLAVFLWLEARRLGQVFDSASAYARSPARLFPRSSRVRNIALHSRDRWKLGRALPGWTDYPRAALLRALIHCLAAGDEPAAAASLGVHPPELKAAYQAWWSRYN